jgi:hypothetical protein
MAERTYPPGTYVGVPLSAYRPYITMPAATSIPVLDQEFKSTGGINFNHAGYLEVQKLYAKDMHFLMRNYPAAYMRLVLKAWFCYFLPESDLMFFDLNRPPIRVFDRLCNIVFCGQLKYSPIADRRKLLQMKSPAVALYTGVFLLVGLPVLFIFSTWFLYQSVRRHTLNFPQALLLGFILYNIAYVTITANFLSSYENNRYRFPLDGFYVVLAALAVEQLRRRLVQRRQGRGENVCRSL